MAVPASAAWRLAAGPSLADWFRRSSLRQAPFEKRYGAPTLRHDSARGRRGSPHNAAARESLAPSLEVFSHDTCRRIPQTPDSHSRTVAAARADAHAVTQRLACACANAGDARKRLDSHDG